VQRVVFRAPEKSPEEKTLELFQDFLEEDNGDAELPWIERASADLFMGLVIIVNTIVIGVEVDAVDASEDPPVEWIIPETLFCMIFVLEVGCRMFYHGQKHCSGNEVQVLIDGQISDDANDARQIPFGRRVAISLSWIFAAGWNFIIFAVAVVAVISLLLNILVHAGTLEAGAAQDVLRLISLLRVISLLRLVRVIGRYKVLEELRLVVQGLLGSFQMLFWTVVLNTIFLYVCAVIGTKVIGHNRELYANYRKLSGGWDHEEYFGTVGRSMYSLFEIMTLDSWSSNLLRHVIENQWYMAIFFLGFVLLSTYGLLNLVISIIVEHTLTSAEKNVSKVELQEMRRRKQELDTLRDLFDQMDGENTKGETDGKVDLKEFQVACRKHEVRTLMRQLEIPISKAAELFEIMDGDGDRCLDMDEFIEGCSKIKGPAKSQDLLAAQAQADILSQKMQDMEATLKTGERMMTALDEVTLRVSRRFDHAKEGSRRKIAHSVGGSAPVVPPAREKPGGSPGSVDLSVGNRPILPAFPNFLR